jgi:hypothetical protein
VAKNTLVQKSRQSFINNCHVHLYTYIIWYSLKSLAAILTRFFHVPILKEAVKRLEHEHQKPGFEPQKLKDELPKLKLEVLKLALEPPMLKIELKRLENELPNSEAELPRLELELIYSICEPLKLIF